MNIWHSASDRTEHFRFESGDCLYRDHRGHRVIADWEGPGTVHLIRSDVSFQINGLDIGGVLFPFSFGDFATITAIEEGTFEAVVTGSWNARLQSSEAASENRQPRTDNQERVLDAFSILESNLGSERNWKAQNLSAPEALNSQFEDGTEHIGYVSSLLNACSFDVHLPANCIGIRISKTYDQFHGRQCARVWCDDDFKGLWYLPRQNRVQRWAKGWFGFEIERTSSERVMRITMDPPGGTTMWSMSEITVIGLFLNPCMAGY